MSTQFRGQPVRPYRAPEVNAGSSIEVDYSSRDPDGVLEAPTVLRYRIDNLTDALVVLEWTNVNTPGTEGSVSIGASLNAMSRTFRDRQLNQVTFEATYASGSKVQQLAHYQLCAVYQGNTGS